MADLDRVRKVTLPDGSSPFYLDGRVIITALPGFITINMSRPILLDGEDYQSSQPRQFSVTFIGTVYEETTGRLRRFMEDLDEKLGLRNRRFYLNDDRYWFVRSEGARYTFPHAGVRDRFVSLELYFRILDPYLRDGAGTLYRSW